MSEPRGDPRFAFEPRIVVTRQQLLDRDRATESAIVRAYDPPHPAAGELARDRVVQRVDHEELVVIGLRSGDPRRARSWRGLRRNGRIGCIHRFSRREVSVWTLRHQVDTTSTKVWPLCNAV